MLQFRLPLAAPPQCNDLTEKNDLNRPADLAVVEPDTLAGLDCVECLFERAGNERRLTDLPIDIAHRWRTLPTVASRPPNLR